MLPYNNIAALGKVKVERILKSCTQDCRTISSSIKIFIQVNAQPSAVFGPTLHPRSIVQRYSNETKQIE
jgi:hypothetical protein